MRAPWMCLPLLLVTGATARAEGPPPAPDPRAAALWLGGGGVSALPGFGGGAWVGAGFKPHGTRFGARVEAFIVGDEFGAFDDHTLLAASLTYQGARTGRHFAIDLYAGAGVRLPDLEPLLQAGVASRLGVLWQRRVHLGLDGGLRIVADELPLEVALVTVFTLGIGW